MRWLLGRCEVLFDRLGYDYPPSYVLIADAALLAFCASATIQRYVSGVSGADWIVLGVVWVIALWLTAGELAICSLDISRAPIISMMPVMIIAAVVLFWCVPLDAGAAHGDDLDGIGALDGSQRVAGVDRADEGVGRFDGGDFGNLRHIKQSGDTRCDVFAEGGGRGQDVAVAGGIGDNQRSQVLGGLRVELGGIGDLDLGDALQRGGLLGSGGTVGAGDQHVDVATDFLGGGDGVQGGGLQALVVVFGDNENGHDQITLASFFSLFTRSATSATLMPALRFGGSLTLMVVRRGATSTPRSGGLTVSSGFFLAFMMLGSVA